MREQSSRIAHLLIDGKNAGDANLSTDRFSNGARQPGPKTWLVGIFLLDGRLILLWPLVDPSRPRPYAAVTQDTDFLITHLPIARYVHDSIAPGWDPSAVECLAKFRTTLCRRPAFGLLVPAQLADVLAAAALDVRLLFGITCCGAGWGCICY